MENISGIIGGLIFILLIIAIFTVPVGMFNTKMFRGSNGAKPTGMELVKAYIPFVNVRYARVLAYGSSNIFLGALIVCGIGLLVRAIAYILVAMNIGVGVYLAFFSAFVSLGVLCIWWILAAINGVDFANMLQAGFATKLLCICIPPLGYYMLSNIVIPYFKSAEAGVNDTFGAKN